MNAFDDIKYNLDTNSSIDEVVSNLRDNIEKRRMFRIDRAYCKLFQGEITNNQFEIQKIVNSKNMIVPKIKGKIHETVYGTNIKIEISASLFGLAQIILLIFVPIFTLFVAFMYKLFYESLLIFLPIIIVFGFYIYYLIGPRYTKEIEYLNEKLIKIVRQEKPFDPNFKLEKKH